MPSLKAMAREAQKKPKFGAPKQQVPNRKQTVFKSTERVADSDLESETESESESDSEDSSAIAPVPVLKLNGQKPKPKPVAANIEVESEEKDDEEVESEAQVDVVVSSDHHSTSVQSGAESESESNKGSDSESELEEEHRHDNGKAIVATEKPSSHREEEDQVKSDMPRAIPTYNPPDGFTILSASNNGKQKVAEVFGRSNLTGKQLWYITAPVSVPISEVNQVSLQDVQLGKPVLSFCGRDYGFLQDQHGEMDSHKVLVPEENSNAYRVGQKAIDQTLHLQQVVQLHKITQNRSIDYNMSANITKNPVRKQPEGLKMRFKPIGFGHGKIEATGLSSSSSDGSSSTDNDSDQEMEDAQRVSRQRLDLDRANTRLSQHASKASESKDDTSRSGEETEDPPRTAAAESRSKYSNSSETSNDEMEELPKSMQVAPKSSNSPPRPMKRKLSDFKKDDRTLNTPYEQFKTNGMPLKTSNVKKSRPVSTVSVAKVNGNAIITKQKFPSTSPSELAQASLPRSSGTAPSHVENSNSKITGVLPTRQSSILPPGFGSKSPDGTRVMKAAGARPETSQVNSGSTLLPSEKRTHRNLEDHLQSNDPALSEKEQKKEIRRLKKNEASRISKQQRRESRNSATSDTLGKSINASSPLRNDLQHVIKAGFPTKISTNKDLSQKSQPKITTGVEKILKKPKKCTPTSTKGNENGGTQMPSQETPKTLPSPGKGSVILPPKFTRSIST